jgi:hypothetical protein
MGGPSGSVQQRCRAAHVVGKMPTLMRTHLVLAVLIVGGLLTGLIGPVHASELAQPLANDVPPSGVTPGGTTPTTGVTTPNTAEAEAVVQGLRTDRLVTLGRVGFVSANTGDPVQAERLLTLVLRTAFCNLDQVHKLLVFRTLLTEAQLQSPAMFALFVSAIHQATLIPCSVPA